MKHIWLSFFCICSLSAGIVVFQTYQPLNAGLNINKQHLLARDLDFFVSFREAGGNPVDLVTQMTFVRSGTTSWVVTPYGPGMSFASGGFAQFANFGGALVSGNGARTTAVLFQLAAGGSGADQVFFNHGDNTAGNQRWTLYYTHTAPALSVEYRIGGVNANWTFDSKWHIFLVSYDGSTIQTSAFKFYLDGQPMTIGTPTGSGQLSTGADTPTLGILDVASADPLSGNLAGVWEWRRVLTPAEVLLHYQDPFAMLYAPRRVELQSAATTKIHHKSSMN